MSKMGNLNKRRKEKRKLKAACFFIPNAAVDAEMFLMTKFFEENKAR